MSQAPNAPAQAPAPTTLLRQIPRRYVALGLIILAIALLGTLVLVRDNSAPSSSSTVETFNAAPPSLVSMLDLPASVYDTIGVSSPTNPVTPPNPTGSATLWQATTGGGATLPVVYFYGAEFAPYAAAQRWPVILALSRFGTFTQLGLMQSSNATAFPNLSTFTFWDVGYQSKYLILQPVERYSSLNPTGAGYLGLQLPSARQAAAVSQYATGSDTFALTDVANKYVLSGSSYSPAVLDGLSQDQIAGYLATPAAPLTQAVVAAANEISATICAVDRGRPGSVCQSRGVQEAAELLKHGPSGPAGSG
jgi:Domain of unknown function (DUF929)